MEENSIFTDNLYFLASAFSRKLSAESDDVFATMGMASSHALILMLVDEQPEIQPNQLAKILYLKPSTITRLVQKLERRGLLERSSEGRASYITCTPEGEEAAGKVREHWNELMESKKEELGERYTEVLSEMITNALKAMDAESESE